MSDIPLGSIFKIQNDLYILSEVSASRSKCGLINLKNGSLLKDKTIFYTINRSNNCKAISIGEEFLFNDVITYISTSLDIWVKSHKSKTTPSISLESYMVSYISQRLSKEIISYMYSIDHNSIIIKIHISEETSNLTNSFIRRYHLEDHSGVLNDEMSIIIRVPIKKLFITFVQNTQIESDRPHET